MYVVDARTLARFPAKKAFTTCIRPAMPSMFSASEPISAFFPVYDDGICGGCGFV